MRIAYLEDEPAHARLVKNWIEQAGHSCTLFSRGESLIRELNVQSYDLILLDWELPDLSGIEVVQRVRERIDWHIPVLFLTNRVSDEDVVQALREGADDFISKPLSRSVTLARIDALTRRFDTHSSQHDSLDLGDYRIDRTQRTLYHDGEPIELTDKEFQLAQTLFSNLGRLFSRDHLLEQVWGVGPGLTTRTVDTHISRIRRKLEIEPQRGWRLKAVYNHGYRLERIMEEPNPE
jgi:DNA-binding response OmpR family regulator